jgi:hypothetical protein
VLRKPTLGWPKEDSTVERSAPLLRRKIDQAFRKSRSIHGGLIVDQEFPMNAVTDGHRARPLTTFDVESLFAIDFAPVQQCRCAEKSMLHYLFHVLRERDMEKSRVCICKLISAYWHD